MTTIRDGLKDALNTALDPVENKKLARKIKEIGYHLVPAYTTVKMLKEVDFSRPEYVTYTLLEDIGKMIETATPYVNSAFLLAKEAFIDFCYIKGLQGDLKAGLFGLIVNAAGGTLYENFLSDKVSE